MTDIIWKVDSIEVVANKNKTALSVGLPQGVIKLSKFPGLFAAIKRWGALRKGQEFLFTSQNIGGDKV